RELSLAETSGEAPVEGERRVAQRLEHPLAGGRQLDAHGAPVVGVATAHDEAGALEAVQVAGERRALDAHRTGEFELGAARLLLQRDEHEPERQRAARLR